MRVLLKTAGLFGSVSVAFGSVLWSQKKTQPDAPNSPSADLKAGHPYELKLVQVVFRHGARTPLKPIPDVMEVKKMLVFFILHIMIFL